MRTKTALVAAILLGLFTYTLSLYAANKEYHLEEQTVIEIPIVGKITTLTSSHFSGCKLMETTVFKMHNSLIKAVSESNGKRRTVQLTDLCNEIQWQYHEADETYKAYTFDELRTGNENDVDEQDVQIDMGIDQNDINQTPRITREILGMEKNINGKKARKVVTQVHFEKAKNPLVIEEYYSSHITPLVKVMRAREDLSTKIDNAHSLDGVPDFIKLIYRELQEDQEWERPEGDVVRLIIWMLDAEEDPVFTLNYDVTLAEETDFNEDHFTLK